jgi:pimeloyl-ACP methyl ester carboxylesterase
VVALDLAGYGQSGGGRKDWTMAAFGQDVVSVVEALGLKRVVLIGHSLGGPAVLEAARRMPGRVVGLVLVDSWVDFEGKIAPEERAAECGDAAERRRLGEWRVSSDFRGAPP